MEWGFAFGLEDVGDVVAESREAVHDLPGFAFAILRAGDEPAFPIHEPPPDHVGFGFDSLYHFGPQVLAFAK